MRQYAFFLIALALIPLLIVACGDDDDDDDSDDDADDDSDDDSDDDDDAPLGDIFPMGLAVASPLRFVESDDGDLKATHWQSAFTWATKRIESLLNGNLPVNDAFIPEQFYVLPHDAMCYGPSLMYEDHPDGTIPNLGELPTGDLGIWLEVDEVALGGMGDACAAAQLNTRLQGGSDQSLIALMSLASMLSVAYDLGYAIPSVGASLDMTADMNAVGIPNVSFNNAGIETVASDQWAYEIDFDYTRSGDVMNIFVSLSHTSNGSMYEYEGLLYYRADWLQGLGHDANCSNPEKTINGSILYERTSEFDMDLQSRLGVYCGYGAGGVDVTGQVDVDDGLTDVNTDGWSQNFNVFVANFDPTKIDGDYAYLWQAGPGDARARILNLGLNDHEPLDGEAYFGYGDPIGDSDGSVLGFICNWAAPGQTLTLHDLAQRQFLKFNDAMGVFDQPTGGSDILYAPTNSCVYDGEGGFWYDRNLSGTIDETLADLIVNPYDMMTPAAGQTITEAIAGRGYNLPYAPGGWPSDY
jgi:hypothetical protein